MADNLAVLRTAKQAMTEGLIGDDEYQMIKQAFTKAQMIKAGLDAGFIKEEDYMQARNAFLQSLDFQVQDPPAPATVAASLGPIRGVAPMSLGNGAFNNGGAASLARASPARQSSPARTTAATHLAPPPPPPPPVTRLPTAAVSVPAVASTRASSGSGALSARNVSGTLPGTVPVPRDLARIGRTGTAEGKKSMSGIGLDDNCINLFNHIKTKSTYKWVTFKIDDLGSTVIVDLLGAPDGTFEQFVALLPSSQCRYAVYDYGYCNTDTGFVTQKLVFVHWSPEGSTTKAKMMYSSTKDFIKGFLEGVGAELQADCAQDLTEEEMQNKIAGAMTRK